MVALCNRPIAQLYPSDAFCSAECNTACNAGWHIYATGPTYTEGKARVHQPTPYAMAEQCDTT